MEFVPDGELGLYGFRNRVAGETALRLAKGGDVRVKRVWDWLGEHGFTVAPLFVPLTSPPVPGFSTLITRAPSSAKGPS